MGLILPLPQHSYFTMVCILICTSDDSDYATLGSKKRIKFGTLSVTALQVEGDPVC